MGLLILESSYDIYFLYWNLRTLVREIPFNERKQSIIEDNNVFKDETFVIDRFIYIFEFGQNQKVNLSLFIKNHFLPPGNETNHETKWVAFS